MRINLTRERRIREHLAALGAAMQDPGAAELVERTLNREVPVEESLMRLPRSLLDRASAQWDRLMEVPEFRAASPRRSGAAAVRMILELKLAELEAEQTKRKKKS